MRIWHENLIPKLCRKHLLAMWREGLGAYSIITNNKKGYRNHPAVKEFENCPHQLWHRLKLVRTEAIRRGYNFKELPKLNIRAINQNKPVEWQTYDEQVKVLKAKNCKCKI